MMNSKPDIAVIYNSSQLQFLECKFLSDVDKDSLGNTQVYYQDRIAEFLQIVEFVQEKKDTKVIRFVRKKKKADTTTECEVLISDLIEREKTLFNIEQKKEDHSSEQKDG